MKGLRIVIIFLVLYKPNLLLLTLLLFMLFKSVIFKSQKKMVCGVVLSSEWGNISHGRKRGF